MSKQTPPAKKTKAVTRTAWGLIGPNGYVPVSANGSPLIFRTRTDAQVWSMPGRLDPVRVTLTYDLPPAPRPARTVKVRVGKVTKGKPQRYDLD